MRKIIILAIFMISLLIPSLVSAGLTVSSVDGVDFLSNDANIQGKAFKILAFETLGSEQIAFSLLENALQDGYKLEPNAGFIKGQISDTKASYSLSTKKELWGIEVIDESYYQIGINTAYDNCADKIRESGNPNVLPMVGKINDRRFGIGYYACYAPIKIGDVQEVVGESYDWKETFTIYNQQDSKTQNVIITSKDPSNVVEFSPDRNIAIKYIFSGSNDGTDTIPDFSTKYSVLLENSESKVINYISNDEPYNEILTSNGQGGYFYSGYDNKYNIYYNFYWKLLGSEPFKDFFLYGNPIGGFVTSAQMESDEVYNLMFSESQTFRRATSISYSGYTSRLESGEINLYPISGSTASRTLARVPAFDIRLDAEWVGIYQVVGKPVLSPLSLNKDKFVEGDDNAYITSEVKNNADADGVSFNYAYSCSSGLSISGITSDEFNAYQTKTTQHRVSSTVTGQTINGECCLTVKDSQSTNQDRECIDITFLEANQCNFEGQQKCSGNDIVNCIKQNDGVLVWSSNTINCQYECILEDGRGKCKTPPSVCDLNATCDGTETYATCKDDCTVPNDKYCSTIKGEDDPESPNYSALDCGCPEGKVLDGFKCVKENNFDPITLILILGGLGLAFAVVLRLKKEGMLGGK